MADDAQVQAFGSGVEGVEHDLAIGIAESYVFQIGSRRLIGCDADGAGQQELAGLTEDV